MKLTTPSPPKINLFLDVLRRRPNGCHEILTVFAPLIAPLDKVTLETTFTPGIEIKCSHADVPKGEKNICWRAANAFAEATRCQPHWRISIVKKIPVVAGLGGGSSDAGSLLMMLNRACGEPLPETRLHEIAARIGADVPFFLHPVSCALATGMGDKLQPIASCAAIPLVLINPKFPITAAWAYTNHNRVERPPAPPVDRLVKALAAGDAEEVARHTYNALEFAVCDKFPLVRMIIDFLRENGCSAAHVSGSGPTVYGICAAEEHKGIERAVRSQFGRNVWFCATATLTSP